MPARIEVLGMEVVQSIQNMKGDIPLLAHKKTAVRVYVHPSGLATSVPVTGTLSVTREGKCEEIESAWSVELRKDGHHPRLEDQRHSLDRSLCFFLDGAQVEPGQVELCLRRVTPTLRGDRDVGIEVGQQPAQADFWPGPTLSVRVVCLRVRDPRTNQMHEPNAGHRYAMRSFVERAFPVSRVQWSETTLDAATGFEPPYSDGGSSLADPGRTWQEKFDVACAHLMAIRARELEDGEDRATRYYGVVHHPTDFFVGAVSDVPATARPDIVGVGPADGSDGSYAGHELAHMLGRLHPGFGSGQSKEDREFPSAYKGRLSSAMEGHYGFDVGDATQRPRVLPFDHWYDLMTYGEPLWVSAYTYKGLLRGLQEERAEPEKRTREGDYLHVVGTYDLTKGATKGTLAYVFPGRIKSLASVETRDHVVAVGRDERENTLFEANVELKRAAAIDMPRDSGAFHITVGRHERLSRLELWVDHHLACTLAPSSTPRDAKAQVRARILSPSSGDDSYRLGIAWPEWYGRQLSHTVQARRAGDGERWRTIAVGITAATSEVSLDRQELGLPSPVDVRILRAQGFSDTEIYLGQPYIA